jgi:hypothetical protein
MSADIRDFKTEREHTQYENALRTIEALACDGIEQHSLADKNELLTEIRDTVEEAL